MDLQRIKTEINVSLNESVKELGMYAFALEVGADEAPIEYIDDAACMAYALGKIKGNEQVTLHALKSSYDAPYVELWVSGQYQPLVSIIPRLQIPFQNRVRVHGWTGYDGTDSEENSGQYGKMVYVTDYQSVYHTSAKCTHLDLSITQTTKAQVGSERNVNGAKYYECPNCVDGEEYMGVLYITKSGDRYHANERCQSLKRSVKLVLKDSLGDIGQCVRCQENGG